MDKYRFVNLVLLVLCFCLIKSNLDEFVKAALKDYNNKYSKGNTIDLPTEDEINS